MELGMKIGGMFYWEIREKNGLLVAEGKFHNTVPTAHLTHVMNTEYTGGTPVTTWYVGLVNAVAFSAFSAADAPNSHAGWTEFTNYNEAVRQTWGPAVTSGVAANASVMTFTISGGGGSLQGAALFSSSTKGGTGGLLGPMGAFTNAPQVLVATQVFNLTYVNSLTGS